MTVGMVAALRNARADQIKTAVDAGAGAGKLRIYDGTRPATGGTATTLLAELIMTDPSFPAASGGVLTASAIADDTSADATATATWGRLLDSTNVVVLDFSVSATGGGGDLQLTVAAITTGVRVSVTSAVFTEGNA